MKDDDSALAIGRTSSGAEELAKKARGARIVSAFGTVPSEVLFAVYETRRRKRRPAMMFAGDDAKAKRIAAGLIEDLGFHPVDVGSLEMARHLEPFTLLIAQIAYEGDAGPAIAYRFEEYQETS
jgi:predicted dinucleotide-binding enzyme